MLLGFLQLCVFTAPASASTIVWRLQKRDSILLQWRVYEVEMMSDTACSGGILEPEPLTAVVVPHNAGEADKAFDGDTTTAWTSNICSNQCYVGRIYPASTQVRCVRLFQDPDRAFSAYTVNLEYSTSGPDSAFTFSTSYTFLTGGLWLQLDRRWQAPGLRTRWRITNTAVVRTTWRVMEFKLYSDTACEVPLPHDVPLSSLYSSINHPLQALDGDLTTSWAGTCVLGGCPLFSAWIALHLPREITAVSCMKLFQSPNPNELTTSLAVQFWDGNASWTTFKAFANLLGGMELFLSSMLYKTAWRVTNAVATQSAMRINEVRFFLDTQCSVRLIKDILISTDPRFTSLSSPRASSSSSVSSVFDDNFAGPAWISECSECNPNEAYVGLRSTDGAREIACVNIYMEPGASIRDVQVQFIGTIKWEVLYNVVYASGGYWLSLTSRASSPILPRRIYPLYDQPLYRVRVVGSWSAVRSLAFYPNAECRGSPALGSPLASVGVPGAEPVFPLEGRGVWEADGNDGWIGVVLLDKSITVGCVQVVERKRRIGESKVITLEQLTQWPAETFTTIQSFLYDDLSPSPDTFLQIGFESGTLWRIRRADSFAGIPSGANWRISELLWFSSPDCGGSSSQGLLLGSSVLTLGVTDLAMSTDGSLTTYWQPGASDFRPWLGISFGKDPVQVSCVKLYQPIESGFSARVVNLETSDGLSRSWVRNRQINFVSGGIWLTLTSQFTQPVPGTLWRVVNIAPMGKRLYWQIRDLRFFRDTGCSDEMFQIDSGVAVASGYNGADAPMFSAGNDGTKHWSAQCDYCSSYQAWIGFLMPDSMPLAEDPNCVEITTNVDLEVLKWEVEKFTGQDDESCISDPNQRSCWTSLVTSTRKSCVYTDAADTDLSCAEIVFVKTTPRPVTNYVESENAVLVMAAYVAPAAVVLALIFCCCSLLNSPKEDKRPIAQLFVYPTYLWFLFWVGVIILLVLLSFWLVSMLFVGLVLSFVLFGSLLAPIILFERQRAKKYLYTAGPHQPGTRAYLFGVFCLQQTCVCVFDACLFRVTAAYLDISKVDNFVSFLVPVAQYLEQLVTFTSPASFRCGGSSLIFAAVTAFAAVSVLFFAGSYDALVAAECTNVAALLSRDRRSYAAVSMASAVFMGVLQLVSLASAGALFHGFSDSSSASSGCSKEFAADQDPVAVHAPMALYFFGTLSLWVVMVLCVVPVFVAFLSGHFFPSGVDSRLADFLGVPELGVSEKKTDDFLASAVASAEAEAAKMKPSGRAKRATVTESQEKTEMDAIFEVVSDVYKNVFSSMPLLIGRAVPGPFRISERAKLHATAFQLAGAPLLAVQRATVRMVSLIWQCIPVGIFIGKISDYLCLPPVRTAVANYPGFVQGVFWVQISGFFMYIFVLISGTFLSGIVSLLFLVFAIALGVFRASQLVRWVTEQPEPSLAPGNSEEIEAAAAADAASIGSPVPSGNQVVMIGNRSGSLSGVPGQRTIRFLGDK